MAKYNLIVTKVPITIKLEDEFSTGRTPWRSKKLRGANGGELFHLGLFQFVKVLNDKH